MNMMWRTALLVLILSGSGFAQQIPAARLQISGRTLKTGTLSLASPDSSIVLQTSSGSRQVQMHLRPSLSARTIAVPLIARSNSPYRLMLRSAAPLRVLVRSVDPTGGTARLTPDAVNVRAIEGQLGGVSQEITLLEGPRISSGGNDTTIDNAIRLTLEIELPEGVSEADLIFTMDFPAN